jgi:uncharacterized repeat protein (TIGR02543 family)
MNKKSVFKLFGRLYPLFAALLIMTGCTLDPFYIRVAHIEGVPETGEAGTPLTLTGTVRPAFASNKDIVWSVKDAGTTGASISGNILNATAGGIVTITALIADGRAAGKEYTQDFEINIKEGEPPVIPAAWYDVIFESNGGSTVARQKVKEGEYASRPDDPVKSDYNFVNWYDNAGLSEPSYDFNLPVTDNITLYAKWSSITAYTVTFNSNGGNEIPGQTVYEGRKINKPTDPYKSGYKFGGWYKEEALTHPWDFDIDTVTDDITLYAKWLAVYTVTFNANGGNTPASQNVEEGGYAARPGDPEKAGFGFDNWYSDSELTTVYNFNTPVTGDITLYAKWVELISDIALYVTGPMKGETPDTTAAANGTVSYTIGLVSWSPNDNPFMGVTVYTAMVTVTANPGSKFTETLTAEINGHPAEITGRTGTTVTISHTFEPTLAKAVTAIAINSQPVKTVYTHGDTLDLTGLSVKLTYDDDTTDIFTLDDFRDIISENPANGSPLSHTTHNNQPVKVSIGSHHADTNNLTVNKATPTITFPAAAAITYGMTLSQSALTGGAGTPSGAFLWQDSAAIPTVINSGYPAEFTPADTDNYDFTDVPGWDDVTKKVTQSVAITVNPKTITITPHTGQHKVYGAADPEFDYTPNESLLSGNNYSGALGRDAGEDAGTYAFTIGSLTAGSNYSLTLAGNAVFTITKADGAEVAAPGISWNAALNRIEAAPVSAPGNGQTVEYALTINSGSPSIWHDDYNFTVSSAGTYYVYARSKENNNHYAGAASVSAGLTLYSVTFNGSAVPEQFVQSGGKVNNPGNPIRNGYTFGGWYKEAAFTNKWDFSVDTVLGNTIIYAKWTVSQGIGFEIKPDESPTITDTGVVISRSGDNGPQTVSLTVSSGYTNVKWYYNDTPLGDTATIELNSSDPVYNMIGKKFVRVEAEKNGIPYITNIEFEVKP